MSHADLLLQKTSQPFVCRRFECQQLILKKGVVSDAFFETLRQFLRKNIREARERELASAAMHAHVNAAEGAENNDLLSRLLGEHPELNDQPMALIQLPQGVMKSTPLPQDRRKAYQRHLEEMFQQTENQSDIDDEYVEQRRVALERLRDNNALFEASPDIEKASGGLCALCKGGCCTAGGEHAFITPITIREQLESDPSLTADALLQKYLERIPDLSSEGSCVNQTPSGCALPREMRSDVCNTFYCDPVTRLQNEWSETNPRYIYAILRSNTAWNRYAAGEVNPVLATALIDVVNLGNST